MEPPVKNPYVVEITVCEDDIDAQNHVSNVRVLDWANRAAIAHSDALGFDMARYREIKGVFVVRRHEIDYYAPADYSEGKILERRVKLILDVIMARIMFHKEQFTFRREIDKP